MWLQRYGLVNLGVCVGPQENEAARLSLDDAGLILRHMKSAAAGAHDRDALMEVNVVVFSCDCGSMTCPIVSNSTYSVYWSTGCFPQGRRVADGKDPSLAPDEVLRFAK